MKCKRCFKEFESELDYELHICGKPSRNRRNGKKMRGETMRKHERGEKPRHGRNEHDDKYSKW